MRKYRIFVSSVQKEMEPERVAVKVYTVCAESEKLIVS